MSLERDIEAFVASVGLELYDTTVVNENDETIYRISVVGALDASGKRVGVSLDDCVKLTHLISPLLDVTPPLAGEYRLEVSSAGIERKLTKISHYEKSLGELVALTTKSKEKIQGKLIGVSGEKIIVAVEDAERELLFNEISKAKTYFEW